MFLCIYIYIFCPTYLLNVAVEIIKSKVHTSEGMRFGDLRIPSNMSSISLGQHWYWVSFAQRPQCGMVSTHSSNMEAMFPPNSRMLRGLCKSKPLAGFGLSSGRVREGFGVRPKLALGLGFLEGFPVRPFTKFWKVLGTIAIRFQIRFSSILLWLLGLGLLGFVAGT